MWYKIKELVLKTSKNIIKSVIFSNTEYNISSEMAENFNNYFVDSIREIRSSIEYLQYKNQILVINCRFKSRAISLLELIQVRLLRKMIIVGNISFKIITKPLETGIFPDNGKNLKNTDKYEEFRPINLLKTFDNFWKRWLSSSWKNTWRKISYCQNISRVSEGNFHMKRLLCRKSLEEC